MVGRDRQAHRNRPYEHDARGLVFHRRADGDSAGNLARAISCEEVATRQGLLSEMRIRPARQPVALPGMRRDSIHAADRGPARVSVR